VLCFICPPDWNCKYYLDELRLQRFKKVHTWAVPATAPVICKHIPEPLRPFTDASATEKHCFPSHQVLVHLDEEQIVFIKLIRNGGCGVRVGWGSSVHMRNRGRVAVVAVKGCNASKTHVLLQLGYNTAYVGNRQIWVMTSSEITWHWKRSIHSVPQNGRQRHLETHNVWIIHV
jgi:hypothetical protein